MADINLYNDDCISRMRRLPDESIELIVTDPPYNLGNFMKNRDNLSALGMPGAL